MKNELFWYKYQPKNLNQIILLPRVRELIKDGITTNMIFYSNSAGTGKTTLAKILCNNTDNIEFNASEDTSISILRDQLKTHCKTLNPFVEKNSQKTIILDEFDGVSDEYQKAMKGFSDQHQHVRFILTTNYIEKINDKILSRFTKVDFTPKTKDENEYLQTWYFKYLKSIATNAKITISDVDIKKIIMLSFPDLRSATQKLQEIAITKNTIQFQSMTSSNYDDIFNYIFDGKNNVEENYHFVCDNFQDNPLELLKTLGRPLFNKVMNIDNPKLIRIGAELLNTQRSYNEKYMDSIDPIIHLISFVTDIKEILNKK